MGKKVINLNQGFVAFAQESCGAAYPLRDILDNLSDSQILELIEEYKNFEPDEIPTNKIPFDKFWDLYEKKVGCKTKLKKKWDNLPLKTQELIMEYIPKYKMSKPDKMFRKDPQTFFNNTSWEDEIILNQEFDNGLYKKHRYDEIVTLNDSPKFRGVAFKKFRPVNFKDEGMKYVSIEDIKKHKLEIFKPD